MTEIDGSRIKILGRMEFIKRSAIVYGALIIGDGDIKENADSHRRKRDRVGDFEALMNI